MKRNTFKYLYLCCIFYFSALFPEYCNIYLDKDLIYIYFFLKLENTFWRGSNFSASLIYFGLCKYFLYLPYLTKTAGYFDDTFLTPWCCESFRNRCNFTKPLSIFLNFNRTHHLQPILPADFFQLESSVIKSDAQVSGQVTQPLELLFSHLLRLLEKGDGVSDTL